MASNSVHRLVTPCRSSKAADEQARIEVALKQAAAQARKQLAAQGVMLPTPGWMGGAVRSPAG